MKGGHQCAACGTKRYMEFECTSCCVRWLSQMNRAEIQTNAPVIKAVMGEEHLEKVRQAWKEKK